MYAIKLTVLEVVVGLSSKKFSDILAGSNSEAIQHTTLKLTMGKCLNRMKNQVLSKSSCCCFFVWINDSLVTLKENNIVIK